MTPFYGDDVTGSFNEYGEEIDRLFDVRCSPMHRNVPKGDLVVYTPSKNVRQLQVKHPRTGAIELDKLTAVISIDGACRGNGTPSARAAWGVYFGPGSPYNANGLLDPGAPQTSTRAEIEALSQAARIIREEIAPTFSVLEFYIMSDSSFLVSAMSEWIGGWIESDGRGSNGRPVAHYEILREIHELLDEMTYGDDGGMHFKFWLVPREDNRNADALANRAFDG